MKIWILIMLCAGTALEALRHWTIIVELKKSPNKILASIYRAVFLIAFAWLAKDYAGFFEIIICGFLVGFFGFTYLLNIMRGKPLSYLGNGFFDRLEGRLPFIARFWFKLVLAITGGVILFCGLDAVRYGGCY